MGDGSVLIIHEDGFAFQSFSVSGGLRLCGAGSCFWRCFFSMLVQLFIGSVLGFCVFFSNVSSGLLVPEGSLAKGSKELAYAGGCVLL